MDGVRPDVIGRISGKVYGKKHVIRQSMLLGKVSAR